VAETSYPAAGGGGVTDRRYEELMADALGTGRLATFPSSTTLSQSIVYADSTGRQVKVRANQAAIVRGFRWETDGAGLVQPIEANTSGQPRIDLAVLRLNRETWTVSFRIVKGVAAATPIAPASTQKYGATDVWEWPVATIRVTSSTASGLPSIGASDVTALDHHLAQPPMTGNSGRRSPAAWGAVWTDYDTTKTLVGHGGMWHLVGENGARTRIAPATGWAAPGMIFGQRRNGHVTLDCALLTYTGTNRAAGTDVTVCTVPAPFRPAGDVIILGYLNGANLVRLYFDTSAGRLFLNNYAVVLEKNTSVSFPPTSWPTSN
jgi:hypothetical protein